ncbi:MAG: hypothetical protein HYU30_11220 [Chloroflexi bacterium]|nr:hypothetical protein [Chloroflexota bacterium]
MPQYLIEVVHTPEECLRALDAVMLAGAHMLTNSHWGCKDGVHDAWIILEVENDTEARRVVPPAFRHQARVVRLNKFTPEEIRAMHPKG